MAFCSACRPRQISWRWPLGTPSCSRRQPVSLQWRKAGGHAVVARGQDAAILHDDGADAAAQAGGAGGHVVGHRHEVLVPAGTVICCHGCSFRPARGMAGASVLKQWLARRNSPLGCSVRCATCARRPPPSPVPAQPLPKSIRSDYSVPKMRSPASPRPGTM